MVDGENIKNIQFASKTHAVCATTDINNIIIIIMCLVYL